jgi:hypothetical protein
VRWGLRMLGLSIGNFEAQLQSAKKQRVRVEYIFLFEGEGICIERLVGLVFLGSVYISGCIRIYTSCYFFIF